MEQGNISGPMEEFIKESISMIKNMGTEHILGPMG